MKEFGQRTASWSGSVGQGVDLIPILKQYVLDFYNAELTAAKAIQPATVESKKIIAIHENNINNLNLGGFVINNMSMEVNNAARFSINYQPPVAPNNLGVYGNSSINIGSMIFKVAGNITAMAFNF